MTPVGIVGLGLLGGSLAHAVRRAWPEREIVAVEPREDVRAAAATLVDAIVERPTRALGRCGLVILCAPVAVIESLLDPVSRLLEDGAVLTDVAGVKSKVVEAARLHVRSGVRFVGAHPMFGGERGGFEAARADLWRGVVAVCEDHAEPAAIAAVEDFHRALGATVVRCTADAHDAAVARVSHLPYLVAHALRALVERDALAGALAGRGFADATRLSRFAFEVQGEVARRNPHARAAIDALVARLVEIRDALPDDAAARALLGG